MKKISVFLAISILLNLTLFISLKKTGSELENYKIQSDILAESNKKLIESKDQIINNLNQNVTSLEEGLIECEGGDSNRPIRKIKYEMNNSMLDDPYLGSMDAPVLLVAFGDLASASSRLFAKDTLNKIKQSYIDNNKVRFIYRDFFSLDKGVSFRAANIANCAGEQGMYWQAFQTIISNGDLLDEDNLKTLISRIDNIDDDKIEKCIQKNRYKNEFEDDLNDGLRQGAKGAPNFFILKGSSAVGQPVDNSAPNILKGVLIRGAQPFEVISGEIDKLLN